MGPAGGVGDGLKMANLQEDFNTRRGQKATTFHNGVEKGIFSETWTLSKSLSLSLERSSFGKVGMEVMVWYR